MPYTEFQEWVVFANNNPIGITRDELDNLKADHRAALIASVIANANRTKKSRRFKLDDFLIDWSGEKAEAQNKGGLMQLREALDKMKDRADGN